MEQSDHENIVQIVNDINNYRTNIASTPSQSKPKAFGRSLLGGSNPATTNYRSLFEESAKKLIIAVNRIKARPQRAEGSGFHVRDLEAKRIMSQLYNDVLTNQSTIADTSEEFRDELAKTCEDLEALILPDSRPEHQSSEEWRPAVPNVLEPRNRPSLNWDVPDPATANQIEAGIRMRREKYRGNAEERPPMTVYTYTPASSQQTDEKAERFAGTYRAAFSKIDNVKKTLISRPDGDNSDVESDPEGDQHEESNDEDAEDANPEADDQENADQEDGQQEDDDQEDADQEDGQQEDGDQENDDQEDGDQEDADQENDDQEDDDQENDDQENNNQEDADQENDDQEDDDQEDDDQENDDQENDDQENDDQENDDQENDDQDDQHQGSNDQEAEADDQVETDTQDNAHQGDEGKKRDPGIYFVDMDITSGDGFSEEVARSQLTLMLLHNPGEYEQEKLFIEKVRAWQAMPDDAITEEIGRAVQDCVLKRAEQLRQVLKNDYSQHAKKLKLEKSFFRNNPKEKGTKNHFMMPGTDFH